MDCIALYHKGKEKEYLLSLKAKQSPPIISSDTLQNNSITNNNKSDNQELSELSKIETPSESDGEQEEEEIMVNTIPKKTKPSTLSKRKKDQ
jgi:hypothetical protein